MARRRRCRISGSTVPIDFLLGDSARMSIDPTSASRARSHPDDPAIVERAGAASSRDRPSSRSARAAERQTSHDRAPDASPTWGSAASAGAACSLSALAGRRALATALWFARFVDRRAGARGLGRLDRASRCCCLVGLCGADDPAARVCRLLRASLASAASAHEVDAGAERERCAPASGARVRHLQLTCSRRRPTCLARCAAFREHERDVHDAGELLALADRELVAPLDQEARAPITRRGQARRHGHGHQPDGAGSPMIYVLIENLRMLRALRRPLWRAPGPLGALRLAQLVFGHIVATGGVALTDDLLGQFLGQDLSAPPVAAAGRRRLQRRADARIGAAGSRCAGRCRSSPRRRCARAICWRKPSAAQCAGEQSRNREA